MRQPSYRALAAAFFGIVGFVGCGDDTTGTGSGEPNCGNGVEEGEEQCDGEDFNGLTCEGLGYSMGTLACNADCTFDETQCEPEACGNGTLDDGEECDGDDLGGQTCAALGYYGGTPSCLPRCAYDLASCEEAGRCGDGIVNGPEDCDDNGESFDCDADCTQASCGDTTVNTIANEECDAGSETTTCNADCTLALCGDGLINLTAGEECDDTGESATCDADCTPAGCGDGLTNLTAGEQCDDAGESATCDSDCTPAQCGDMVINVAAGEDCEGGPIDICDAACHTTGCGPDPVALALAACALEFPNCTVDNGGVVGWQSPACHGCNCMEQWRFYCTETTATPDNFHCAACSVGQVLGAHVPCSCNPSTAPFLDTFCVP